MPTSAPGSNVASRRPARRDLPEHLQPPLGEQVQSVARLALDEQRVPFPHALRHHRCLDGGDSVLGRAAEHRQQAQRRARVRRHVGADGGARARRPPVGGHGGLRDLAGGLRQLRERRFDPLRGRDQRAREQHVVGAAVVVAQRRQSHSKHLN